MKNIQNKISSVLKDAQLNLSIILDDSSPLNLEERLYIALSVSFSLNASFTKDILETIVNEGVRDDKKIEAAAKAASLMAMNNTYYSGRSLIPSVHSEGFTPRLRMNAIGNHGVSKKLFELMCLSVSFVGHCKDCVLSHSDVIISGGGRREELNEALRISSAITGAAKAIEISLYLENISPS